MLKTENVYRYILENKKNAHNNGNTALALNGFKWLILVNAKVYSVTKGHPYNICGEVSAHLHGKEESF